MKPHPGNLVWVFAMILALAGWLVASRPSPPDAAAVKAVADTRQMLREQGFKTDLVDFDFSTIPELQARETILQNTTRSLNRDQYDNLPNLMQPIGNDSALVVWKLDSVKLARLGSRNDNEALSWDVFRALSNPNSNQIDAVAAAVMSGPIRFNLKVRPDGSLRLPHLALVRNLTRTFVRRSVLALHDGDLESAWTNLMAATRLVTAREPEPVETSHLVRFADTSLAFNALWQALQTTRWSDVRLTQLQREWESVDFFTNLPTTKAFQRASVIARCEQEHAESSNAGQGYIEFAETILRFPLYAWMTLSERQQVVSYNQRQSFQDEQALMLYFRDRETEFRNAVKATNWTAMRQSPAMTHVPPSSFGHPSRFGLYVSLYDKKFPFQRDEQSLLARAAQAEAQRRIIITAIALERFHIQRDSYPKTLIELTPEFLGTPLPDFMDGQPLRYRLTDDGPFLLYSVGLDCVDNGGKIRRRAEDIGFERPAHPGALLPEADLVWPLPAGAAAMQAEQQIRTEARKVEAKAKESEQKHYLTEISGREWNQSPARQARVAKILAMKRPVGYPEPTFKGQSAGNLIRNAKVSGTNELSLDALLTPKQIITGKEPEDITFELPISYGSFITNNIVFPIVDADPEEELPFDCGGKVYDRERATNGDCLLIWHAIYDPPGRHAVQVYLALKDEREGTLYGIGPPIAVTTSNLCQFSLDSANYDVERGATFHARLPEKNGLYSIECVSTNGEHLKTLTGSTKNGEFKIVWNLVDDQGRRLNGETFNSIMHITLPDSGRTQTLRGP